MKIIKIVLVFFLIFFSNAQAEESTSWLDKATTYTKSKLHDVTTEDITFKSHYKESSTVGWIAAGIFAIVAAGTIFFTGGTASPIVVSIGTWIGGALGYSGAVATNVGLALLGGGSIASGGFGIVGGTALLTAALSYSTDVIFDYTVGSVISEYSYSQFAKESKNLMTLPLPKNRDGCNAYENAMDTLESIDNEVSISNEKNQKIIKTAIKEAKKVSLDIDKDDLVKDRSLIALLYFITNDYKNANIFANESIKLAKEVDTRYTLPAFVYATSSFYDKQFNFDKINSLFKYSVIKEPDNPIIPLLFSIYLDRMMYRMNDGYLKPITLEKVFKVAQNESIKDLRLQNYIIILSRYLIRLKLEQQKISSLCTTENKTIKNSPKTLEAVQNSLKNYKQLTSGAKKIVSSFPVLENNEDNKENIKQIDKFSKLVEQYNMDTKRLEGLINQLKTYQESSKTTNWILIGIGSIVFVLIILFILGRRKDEK